MPASLIRRIVIPAVLTLLASWSFAQTRKAVAAVAQLVQPASVLRPASLKETTARRSILSGDAPLYAGDVLETDAGGRLRVLFKDGSVVILGSRTRFQVPDSTARPRFQLVHGIARVQSSGASFEILTQTALCRAPAGEVLVDARSPVATFVLNLGKSVIELEGERGKARLQPGEGLWTDRGFPSRPRGEELQKLLEAAELKPPAKQ